MMDKIKKIHRLLTGEPNSISIILVGVGGTGSFAALNLARLAYAAKDTHRIRLTFVDPDYVEPKNIGRQYFAPADVGQPKAVVLASRMSLAFGLEITPVVGKFETDMIDTFRPAYSGQGTLTLVIGAVDSPAARQDIARAMVDKTKTLKNLWWLDAGNSYHSGQVLIGNNLASRPLISEFGDCVALPLPSVQEPSLLEPETPPLEEEGLSCADLTLLNLQARTINYQMAAWLDIFVERLIISHDLDVMGVYLNQTSGVTYSVPISDGILVEESNAASYPAGYPANQADEDEDIVPCPQCGTPVITGDNMLNGQIHRLVFCPACNWEIWLEPDEPVTEELVQRRLAELEGALELV
jgi:PRTRC genetic system ThiF family protein